MAKKTSLEKEKNKVLIITNGQRSEKNYFDLMKAKYDSPYQISTKFLGGDPEYLAEYSISVKDEYNKIFIVVDVDQFHRSIEAAEILLKRHKNTIFLIVSNISFEVWLVNHYKELNAPKTINELINDINCYLKNEGSKSKYEKNDKKIIEKYFIDKLFVAAKVSRVIYQRLYRDFSITNKRNPKITELISSSLAYKIVDELKLVKKEE